MEFAWTYTNSLCSLEDKGIDGFDIVSADGVVNLRLGAHGTYVLNKQTPTRQLWLSSPVSGPWHYEWTDSELCWRILLRFFARVVAQFAFLFLFA